MCAVQNVRLKFEIYVVPRKLNRKMKVTQEIWLDKIENEDGNLCRHFNFATNK